LTSFARGRQPPEHTTPRGHAGCAPKGSRIASSVFGASSRLDVPAFAGSLHASLTAAMHKKPVEVLRVLCSLVLLATVAEAGPVELAGQTEVAEPPPTQATSDASLLPGDVVRIQIWREDGLSGDFQVDESGVVTLPLLGRKTVLGISPDSLRDQLTSDYDEYLVNPSINVTLLRRVTVLGEVRVPGLYPVDATVSVAQLIALAQGVTPDGDVNRLTLVRGGQTIRVNLAGTMALTDAGIRSGDQLIVGKRSWIARNLSSLAWITSIATNLVVLATR